MDHDRFVGRTNRTGEHRSHLALGLGELGPVGAVSAEVPGQKHGIDLGRSQQLVHRPLEGPDVLLTPAGEVDGITRPTGRSDGACEPARESGREGRDREPARLDDIRGEGTVTTSVGEHRRLGAGRGRSEQEPFDDIDHLLRRGHPLDTGGGAGGVDRPGTAHDGAGVRTRRSGGGLARSHGEEHHGLAGGRARRGRLEKAATVSEILAVHSDRLDGVRRGEGHDQLRDVKIGLVAGRGEPAETEPCLSRLLTQLERKVATLGDQPDRPVGKIVRREVQLGSHVEQAETVGTEQHSPRFANSCRHRLFELAAIRACLPETRADADDGAGAGEQRVVDGVGEGGGRHGDDRELDTTGNVRRRAMARSVEHRAARAVDEVDPAPVLTAQSALCQPVPPLARVVRGTDDGDRIGREESRQVPGSHSARHANGALAHEPNRP